MPDTIIYLDPSSPLNLQEQIRQKLVDGILSGALPPVLQVGTDKTTEFGHY